MWSTIVLEIRLPKRFPHAMTGKRGLSELKPFYSIFSQLMTIYVAANISNPAVKRTVDISELPAIFNYLLSVMMS